MIGRLSFADYDILVNAITNRLEDKNRDLHYGAYLGSLAGERDAKGKPRFPTFNHFYKHKSGKNDRFEKMKEYYRSKQNE